MSKMKETAIDVLKLIALGVIVMSGVRLAEWTIPAPEMKIIVCLADDMNRIESCQSLNDLVKHRSK